MIIFISSVSAADIADITIADIVIKCNQKVGNFHTTHTRKKKRKKERKKEIKKNK